MRRFFLILTAVFLSAMALTMIGCTDADQPPDTDESQVAADKAAPDNTEYATEDYALRGDWYAPTRFTIEGRLHFAYWFNRRPPSYDAYMWRQWKVRADPYGANGVLVQKRDLCLYCSCNPWICLNALRLREK